MPYSEKSCVCSTVKATQLLSIASVNNLPAPPQFELLMELFQDEEKVTSPTGPAHGTGGRTRLSVKPDKSREKSSREHKKTVGCQVDKTSPQVLSCLNIVFALITQWLSRKYSLYALIVPCFLHSVTRVLSFSSVILCKC